MFAAFDPRAAEEETQGRCTPLAAIAVGADSMMDTQDNQSTQEGAYDENQEGDITTEFVEETVFDHPHFNLAAGAVGAFALIVTVTYMAMRPSADKSKVHAGTKGDAQADSTSGWMDYLKVIVPGFFLIGAIVSGFRNKFGLIDRAMNKNKTSPQEMVREFQPVLIKNNKCYTIKAGKDEVFAKIHVPEEPKVPVKQVEGKKAPAEEKVQYVINTCTAFGCDNKCEKDAFMDKAEFEAMYEKCTDAIDKSVKAAHLTKAKKGAAADESLISGMERFKKRVFYAKQVTDEDLKNYFPNENAFHDNKGEKITVSLNNYIISPQVPEHTFESKFWKTCGMSNPSTAKFEMTVATPQALTDKYVEIQPEAATTEKTKQAEMKETEEAQKKADKEKAEADKENADKVKAEADKEKNGDTDEAQKKAEQEKAEQEKAAKEKADQEKTEQEKAEQEKAAKEKADKEKNAAKK